MSANELSLLLNFLSLIVSISGFIFVIVALRESKKALQASVSLSFFQRFSDLDIAFPDLADRDNWHKVLNSENELTENAIVFFRQYFYLCSEEHKLYSLGRIPEDIWRAWEKEIRYNISYPTCELAWQKLRHKFDRQPLFVEYMDSYLNH